MVLYTHLAARAAPRFFNITAMRCCGKPLWTRLVKAPASKPISHQIIISVQSASQIERTDIAVNQVHERTVEDTVQPDNAVLMWCGAVRCAYHSIASLLRSR